MEAGHTRTGPTRGQGEPSHVCRGQRPPPCRAREHQSRPTCCVGTPRGSSVEQTENKGTLWGAGRDEGQSPSPKEETELTVGVAERNGGEKTQTFSC